MFRSKIAAPGVRVVCVNTDAYKTNVIEVSMALPLDERAPANALLIKLLRRTSKAYPDFTKLNAKLDELYGAVLGGGVSKYGDAQILSLGVTCLDDRFSLTDESISNSCLELLADMIFNPNSDNGDFGEDNLALEKRLLINQIIEEQDDKRSYALNKCIELMCAGEPFGHHRCGTIEEIERVTMADICDAWSNLLKTAVFQITAVGGIDIDMAASVFADKFASIDRDPVRINHIFVKESKSYTKFEEYQPINQGKLVIGYRTGMENVEDNYYPYKVMCDIFGGGTYSKLFANVREKMSLAYYCSSRLVASKGLIFVQSGIDTDKEDTVINEVTNQLNDVIQGNFEDETLAASKRSLTEALTLSTPDQICSFYSSQALDEEICTPEDDMNGINSVTKEQVCEMASKLTIGKIFMLASDGTQEEGNED